MTSIESATTEERLAAGLRPYVPRLVAEWRPNPGADGEVYEAEGTLLSADLSGFTALSEKLTRLGREGAEELTALLNVCFEGMIAAIETRGGDVLKFGGDALLVLFSGPGHAERACLAAAATRTLIRSPLQSRNGSKVQLRISQGMHSGRFLLFAVRGEHVEVLVSGPGATETVTCESIAAAGDILLSAASAALVPPAWLGGEVDGRRLLRRTILEEMNGVNMPAAPPDDDLAPFVPGVQREQIAIGVHGEHRRATVGFVKFSHTDALVEQEGAGALAQRLARLAAVVAQAESTHGVHWLSTDIYPDGGKMILTAGAPFSSGHDEDAMLSAVRDVLDAGINLDLCVGVNAGPVFVGDLGSHTRRTFTLMGDAVNLAARLMQKAAPGQLVASNAVLAAVRTPFEIIPLEPFLVKGKSHPIHAALVGQREASLSRAGSSSVAIVGRDVELAALQSVINGARSGAGGVIDIVGEPGTGKTRLIEELRKEPGIESFGVICGQYARTSPYFVVRLLLRTLAGVGLAASRTEAGTALASFVDSAAPELMPWLPLLAVPFDADVAATTESTRVAPAYRRARTHQLVAELLSAAVPRPTAFVVDDAHWIDDASRELLETLAGAIAARPLVICISRRPGPELFPAPASGQSLRIELESLSPDAALDLALAVAGDDADLRPDDWERIVNHAAGNPLFVVELVATAIASGTGGAIPDSVESIVTSRIDTLSAADRLLLREASVLGMTVDLDLLADAVGEDAVRSADRWARLEPFVAPLSPVLFTFRHEIYRQTAYNGLSYRRRREVHRSIGERLESRATDPGDVAELLSIHFSFAGDHRRSWRYSVMAGDRARDKYANVESATLYRRALESARFLDGVEPPALVSVLESLGDVCELGARYDDAAAAYADARRRWSRHMADDTGSVTLGRLFRKSGAVEERRGRYARALRWYGKGLRLLADDASDQKRRSVRAELALAYAGVRYRQGRYRELLRWAHTAAADADAAPDRAALAHAYFLLDLGYTSIGAPERGSFATQALEIFEQLDDHVGQSRALNNLGISAWRSGDWDRSFELFDRSRRAYERSGDAVGAAMAANNAAEILSDQGRLDDAIAMYRRALRTCKSARYPSGAAVITANIGQAEARAGRGDKGLALIDEAIGLLGGLGAAGYELEASVKKTEALVFGGRFDEALEGSEQLLRRLIANEEDVLAAMLQRQRALAFTGAGLHDDAALALDDSVGRAENAGAEYELACSLVARANMARTAGASTADDEQRGRGLLERLGVIAVRAIGWTRP